MSVVTLTENRSGIEAPHIGPAHHRRRNSWLAIGLLAVGAGLAGYSVYWGRQNAAATERLGRFQAAYMQRCDAAAFSGLNAEMVKKLYLRSSTLRDAVDRELVALESGTPCKDVFRALRAVDFPISAPAVVPEKAPTITIQPNAR